MNLCSLIQITFTPVNLCFMYHSGYPAGISVLDHCFKLSIVVSVEDHLVHVDLSLHLSIDQGWITNFFEMFLFSHIIRCRACCSALCGCPAAHLLEGPQDHVADQGGQNRHKDEQDNVKGVQGGVGVVKVEGVLGVAKGLGVCIEHGCDHSGHSSLGLLDGVHLSILFSLLR